MLSIITNASITIVVGIGKESISLNVVPTWTMIIDNLELAF